MLIRFFVSGVTWSVRASSGKLCCVTSPGKLSSALQSLNSLLRDVTLWHGLGLLQMVGFKASVQRTGARWRAQLRKQDALVSRGSRESRDSRESGRGHWRVVLNHLVWTSPTGGWSNQCPYGAELRLHGYFCKAHDHSSSDI